MALFLAVGVACLCALAASVWMTVGALGTPVAAEITPPGMETPTEPPASIFPPQPGSATSQPPNGGNAWPTSDVPMPAEADLGTLIGTPEEFSVITDQDFDQVLAFYQDEMEALGWTKITYGTRITEDEAELQYRNDLQRVTVILARIPFVGTLVEIRLQGL